MIACEKFTATPERAERRWRICFDRILSLGFDGSISSGFTNMKKTLWLDQGAGRLGHGRRKGRRTHALAAHMERDAHQLVGGAAGFFCSQAGTGRAVASTIAHLNIDALVRAESQAAQAYRQEGGPVAIYALTEALEKMKLCEQFPGGFTIPGEPRFRSGPPFALDMMLIHGRLAKLYDQSGNPNLSGQHLAAALDYAQAGGAATVTNRLNLMDFVAKADAGRK